MGDSYDGGEANDSTESGGNAENADCGDDFSAYDDGDTEEDGTGDMEGSAFGEGSEYTGEIAESTAPERVYGDSPDGFNMESSEYADTNEPDDGGDDESAYGDGDVTTYTPDEVESEMPDEIEVNWDGDDESAYEQATDEPQEDTEVPIEQDLEESGYEPEEFSEEELEALQEQADNAAQEYNDKYSPYDRAVSKGVEGVTKTPNGGVSFENSDALYVTEDGKKGVVTIEATGSRSADFDEANKALGLDEKPEGYTWHHLDNYNVKNNTVTLELVRDDAHNSAKPHSGGCAQYDAVHGPTYNPPRQ